MLAPTLHIHFSYAFHFSLPQYFAERVLNAEQRNGGAELKLGVLLFASSALYYSGAAELGAEQSFKCLHSCSVAFCQFYLMGTQGVPSTSFNLAVVGIF